MVRRIWTCKTRKTPSPGLLSCTCTAVSNARRAALHQRRTRRGRSVDVAGPLGEMERDWDDALGALAARYV